MSVAPQHTLRYQRVPPLIRQLREDAGLTQRELAERLGRPQSWVYKTERAGRRLDVAEFCEWCRACGVAARKVIDEIDR